MKKAFLVILVLVLGAGYFLRDKLVGWAPDWAAAYAAKIDPALAKPGTQTATAAAKPAGKAAVPIAVNVAVAKSGTLPVLRSTIGAIVAVDSTELAPEISGTVAKITVKDGAEVKQGDLIVQLDDRAIRAQIAKDQAQIAKDQATLTDAESSYTRTKPLVASGVATAQSGDDALTAVKVAQGTLAVDQAAYSVDEVALNNTQIRAPFDGRLSAVQFSVGAYVAAGTTLVRITRMKPVLAQFSLPVTDLDLLRKTQAAGTLSVAVSPTVSEADAGPKEVGTVSFIDNAVDAASATVTLRASLANDDESLWPGQPVGIDVQAGDSGPVVLVPNVAVLAQTTGTVVYVVTAQDTVESRPVTVALRVGEQAGISEGLKAGEKVIVEGQAAVLPGGKVKIVTPKPAAGQAGDAAKQGQADLSAAGQAVVTKS